MSPLPGPGEVATKWRVRVERRKTPGPLIRPSATFSRVGEKGQDGEKEQDGEKGRDGDKGQGGVEGTGWATRKRLASWAAPTMSPLPGPGEVATKWRVRVERRKTPGPLIRPSATFSRVGEKGQGGEGTDGEKGRGGEKGQAPALGRRFAGGTSSGGGEMSITWGSCARVRCAV